MTDCLVTGMPNVGKTCFVINFAEYMGLKKLKLHIQSKVGYTSISTYSPDEAKKRLISPESSYTRTVQSVKLEIPHGKTFKELEIIDSCGLCEGIHPDQKIRMAMIRTIKLIKKCDFIIHIIDITKIQPDRKDILPQVDRLIMDYASVQKDYSILVNKIDLSYARHNMEKIKKQFSNIIIIPISALYWQGFKEVKKMVLKYV
ncbi:MAG: GTPase [Halanaerobiaceae bacterium]